MSMWSLMLLLAHCILQCSLLPGAFSLPLLPRREHASHDLSIKIAPKVFIIDMFDSEAGAFYGIPEFNVLEHNITVPGFSPLFPQAHCTSNGEICQLTTGEAEINAASTISALVHSSIFDLRTTYFFIAGIAGVNPEVATIGSATFARFGVQVALQEEFDAREKPANFSTGYLPQGAMAPDQYPVSIYGTEVMEINDDLRQAAMDMVKDVTLADNAMAQEYRANYARHAPFAAGAAKPTVVACDTATSDVFWSGNLLGEAFANTTRLFTNGTAVYCTTQQEDNGTLEALLRGALTGLVDFSRIILMRTASDFDRPFPGQTAAQNLFTTNDGGFIASIQNIALVGVPIVRGIVSGWNERFGEGIKPTNYIGDILGSLGGQPDFGPGSVFSGKGAQLRWRSRGRRVPAVRYGQ